ncbi:MAG TPA: cbb3-type cytochrome oxidase assembly protein CcoS [Saprospiraceae bacterium]|nr:cbb3-type cytochrome oxidase assembly protein CcoS [Saprospiraceae bacterium]
MSVIIILLLVSLVLAGGFLVAFFWSVGDGQFDDSYGPAHRILYPDEGKKKEQIEQDKTK